MMNHPDVKLYIMDRIRINTHEPVAHTQKKVGRDSEKASKSVTDSSLLAHSVVAVSLPTKDSLRRGGGGSSSGSIAQ